MAELDGLNGKVAIVTGAAAGIGRATAEALARATATHLCPPDMGREIPAMLTRGGGAIVNCESAAGLVGFPGAAANAASKHGVVGLTGGSVAGGDGADRPVWGAPTRSPRRCCGCCQIGCRS
jgi:NAD(P)-dependent dehydrogenase (short-subunit alcohol dehydrogenase family)